jgi:hypothetical protein
MMEGKGHIPNRIPPFDGNNYAYWIKKTQNYLIYLGVDVWILVVSGYTVSKKPKTATQKEERRNNKMGMGVILDGLVDLLKAKVG